MFIAKIFDPTIAPQTGTFDVTVQDGGKFLAINESSANIILKFGNLATTYVPANDRRGYVFTGQMAQPHTVVTWTVESTLPALNNVNNFVVEVYDSAEVLPESYPAALIRQTQATGDIFATFLQNFTGGSLNFILGGGTAGPSVPDFVGNINGHLTLGDQVGGNGGQVSVIGPDAVSDTEIFPGHITTTATGNADFIQTSEVKLLHGTISRISMFTGTAPNVSTPFNHGLGAVPDMVLLTLTGTNNTASMVKYDASSLTSTQVSIVSDSSRAFVGLAIKFTP